MQLQSARGLRQEVRETFFLAGVGIGLGSAGCWAHLALDAPPEAAAEGRFPRRPGTHLR